MDAMHAEHIPLDKATRIAFASSKSDGFTRWTELAVYYLNMPEFGRKQWLSEAKGCSTEPGEVTKRRALQAGTLARALQLIDTGTDLGRIVQAEAEEWEEENFARPSPEKVTVSQGPVHDVTVSVIAKYFDPPSYETDLEALQWLYGNPDAGVTWPRMIERDFGIGESTTRAALKNGTPVKVPLRAVLKWFDREAFRRDRKGDE
jgi:hypothetical protein